MASLGLHQKRTASPQDEISSRQNGSSLPLLGHSFEDRNLHGLPLPLKVATIQIVGFIGAYNCE